MPMSDLLSKVRKIGDKAPRRGPPAGVMTSQKENRRSMAVLERVATLVRANLNDLIDRAEDPEKMIKQVILDMENQLLQVKTQVAISMADQHLLQKKQKEQEDKAAEWMRKAELAVDKEQDDLARAALERYQSFTKLAEGYTQQVADQQLQVDTLRNALEQLDQKLSEARRRAISCSRSTAAPGRSSKASDAQLAMAGTRPGRRLRSHAAQGACAARPSARPSPSWSPTTSTGGSSAGKRRRDRPAARGAEGAAGATVDGSRARARALQRVLLTQPNVCGYSPVGAADRIVTELPLQ